MKRHVLLGSAAVTLALGGAFGCGGTTQVADGGGGSGSTSTSTGTGAAFAACDGPGQCTLAVPGCCGVCGVAGIDQVDPINESRVAAFESATCTDPNPLCPDCASGGIDPNLYAYCDGAQCQEADLSTGDLSACADSSECTLRSGTGCCTCNGGGGWVAINASKEGELAAIVCEGAEPCPACDPVPPADLVASCVAGHCVAVSQMP